MLNLLFNQNNIDNTVIIISVGIASVGLALSWYNGYTANYLLSRVRQVEASRAEENLPNEVTLTPEDFKQNPELAEILEVTDVDNNLNLQLETIEHIEHLEHQDAAFKFLDNIEVIGGYFSTVLNFVHETFTFLYENFFYLF
jgi:hypothetical protein